MADDQYNTVGHSGKHRRPSICTVTGVEFFVLDPRPEDVRLYDIAHALAYKCRYTGHTQQFYSVAQHSVLVSRWLEKRHVTWDLAAWGLLHDAGEAYLPDVPAPIKPRFKVIVDGGDATFAEVEDRILVAILAKLDLPLTWPMPLEVKQADSQVFRIEQPRIMPRTDWWDCMAPEEPLPFNEIPEELPDRAMSNWLARAAELGIRG